MGVPPYRIDVITELSGIDFAAGWEGHAEATIKDVRVPIISRAALVTNKRAVGRPKDLMDLELLRTSSTPCHVAQAPQVSSRPPLDPAGDARYAAKPNG